MFLVCLLNQARKQQQIWALCGSRAQAGIDGSLARGPSRTTRAKAKRDLHQAQMAQTHGQYYDILQQLFQEGLIGKAQLRLQPVGAEVPPSSSGHQELEKIWKAKKQAEVEKAMEEQAELEKQATTQRPSKRLRTTRSRDSAAPIPSSSTATAAAPAVTPFEFGNYVLKVHYHHGASEFSLRGLSQRRVGYKITFSVFSSFIYNYI